jgi:peptide/nickel transport system substrate-binding protein
MSAYVKWIAVLWIICALGLVGCSSGAEQMAAVPPTTTEPAPAGVPVLRLPGGDNGYPGPFTWVKGPGYVLMSYCFDTLIWKDSQGTIPWLATEWQVSDDGLRWTFTLRDGVKWQDGQPLTVDDVVFTFDYVKTVPPYSTIVRGLQYVDAAHKVDDRHVEIVLNKPYAPFLANIAGTQPILPQHIWQTVTDPLHFTAPEAVMGSGPYELISYDKATGAYLFEANPDFWLGRPYVQRIELVPANDALLALQQRVVDTAALPSQGGITDEVLAPFQGEEYGTLTAPGEWNPAIHFNLNKGAPYDDVAFRQAWAYAIDRDELVQRILLGRGDPGVPALLAPANPWRNPDVERYKYDLTKASALLDGAGYKDSNGDGLREMPNGQPLEVPMLFQSPEYARPAELVRDMLKEAGIVVTLKPVDRATLDASTTEGNFQVALTYYGGLGGDPDLMRELFSSQSQASSFWRAQGYHNARFDELAAAQLAESDEARRREMVYEMQAILAQDLPALPLYYPTRYQIYRKSVLDSWYYTPGGVGSGVPNVTNKQLYVTGQNTGLVIRGQ